MGKKVKVGKQRKDKYYQLAKEAGYRSRAAFKLIQLNKRFEFLQNSQALVDLCAAPGGWLQVAAQNMPVSSLRIGVDLVSIKAIPKCITIQGDIREEKTRHMVKKELQTWNADCVLHDGAPNVGLNWAHDAFQQNCLTLYALRLATQILHKNGYFVTKIFRSSDYLALIGTFEKLFKKVHVWKPAASRLESAEIFVVCEKYLKPARVDPDLLDVKKVFEERAEEPQVNPIRMLTSRKKEKKKKAEGYEENDITQFHDLKASEFVNSTDPLLLLSQSSCISIDVEEYETSKHTTKEICECIRDIKVCGPAELRAVLQWRKKILADLRNAEREKAKSEAVPETEENKEIRELEEIDELIRKAQADEKAKLKKRKRQGDKVKQKLEERKKFNMVNEVDAPLVNDDFELFSLNSIRTLLERRQQIEENLEKRRQEKHEKAQAAAFTAPKKVEKNGTEEYESGDELFDEGVWETKDGTDLEEMETEDSEKLENKNLLQQDLVINEETLMTASEKVDSRTDRWFSKINDLLSDEEDEEDKLDAVAKHMLRRVEKSKMHEKTILFEDDVVKKNKKMDNDELFNTKNETLFAGSGIHVEDHDVDDCDSDDDNLVPAVKRPKVLTPLQLALGEQMIYSAKKSKNLEEWGWNRYANNDTNLPDWFIADEKKHFMKQPPVAQKRVEYYEQRNKELNVRPIKKVLEANARKQKRKIRRMDKAKKRAENVMDNENLEHGEKLREMKKIYKLANKTQKKDVKYQVMTKGKRGTGARPAGPYRVVDKRLKKDKRSTKAASKRNNKKPSGKSNRPRPKSTSGRRRK